MFMLAHAFTDDNKHNLVVKCYPFSVSGIKINVKYINGLEYDYSQTFILLRGCTPASAWRLEKYVDKVIRLITFIPFLKFM